MSSMAPYYAPTVGRVQRVPSDDLGQVRDYFLYDVDYLPLQANAADARQIQIQGDSAFLLAEITGTVKNADADEALIADPAILVEILSSGTGRILMNTPVPWSCIIGTAQRPYVLPAPKTFDANSQITVKLTSLIGVDKRCRVQLHGYKIFS